MPTINNGLKLAARYSYITNRLKYCGPSASDKLFLDFIARKKIDEKKIISALEHFEGLYPYLKAIAEKNRKDFLDYEVIEAYWIGNKLLDKFTNKDLISIIKALAKRGLPKSIALERISKLKKIKGFLPHHSFNVFFVGVGNVTGSVKFNLENMNNCMISLGKIKKVYGKKLLVEYTPLVYQKNKLVFGKNKLKNINYMKEFIPNIKKNDLVTMHWGFAVQKIDNRAAEKLIHYTKKNIDALSKIKS